MHSIDQSHRYGRPQAACREPAGSYDKTTRTAICFEHKTQYLFIRAPYSSSSSLVITSRWFATSRLRAPVSVRLVYWVHIVSDKKLNHWMPNQGGCQIFDSQIARSASLLTDRNWRRGRYLIEVVAEMTDVIFINGCYSNCDLWLRPNGRWWIKDYMDEALRKNNIVNSKLYDYKNVHGTSK